MSQIIFLASADSVASLEADENPSLAYPCMSTQQFHRDARAQLYALVTGVFLDEASEMEALDQILADDGPFIYQLTDPLKNALAALGEDQTEQLSCAWASCEDIETMGLQSTDLHDFMFQLIHFCQVASNDDLGIYIHSDD